MLGLYVTLHNILFMKGPHQTLGGNGNLIMAKKMTVVDMVLGQVATGREVIGTVVKVIPDSKEYKVTSVDVENKTLEITEVLDENAEQEPKVIKLTEANAIVAHYVNNPNEKPAPEAEFSDGKLTIGGKEVNIGTLPIVSVIGGVKGAVLLAAKPKSGLDKKIDFLGYIVQTDKFVTIAEDMAADTKLYILDGTPTLVSNVIETRDVLDDDRKVIGQADYVERVEFNELDVNGEDIMFYGIGGGYEDEYYDEESDDYVTTSSSFGGLNVPVEQVRLVKQAGKSDYVVVTTKDVDKNGNLIDGKPIIHLYKAGTDEGVGTISVNDKTARVYLGGTTGRGDAPVVTVKSDSDFIIRTKYGYTNVTDATVMAAMKGFNLFAGSSFEEDDNGSKITTFTYAKDDLSEVKSFEVAVTDRGTMFKLV